MSASLPTLPRLVVGLLAGAAATAALAGGPQQAFAGSGEERVVVRFEAGTAESQEDLLVDRAGGEVVRDLRLGRVDAVAAAPEAGVSVETLARRLEARSDVLYAEPDVRVRASALPNDPFLSRLWGIRNLGGAILGLAGLPDADADVSEAWDVTAGGGAVIAVADSGVALDHPDLAPAVWTNPGERGSGRETNGRDDDRNGFVDDWRGWDFQANDNDPSDLDGHGSHVAGAAAARGNNGEGTAGVAHGAQIMALRFLGTDGIGYTSDAAEAIAYASRMGARIMNYSFMADQRATVLEDAIAAVPDMLVVAAAGNQSRDLDSAPGYPCSIERENVLCVAATTPSDGLASFSNHGGAVDLAAPGSAIYSPAPSGYSYFQGTSMAAPHVAGAAALALAFKPGASVREVRGALVASVDRRPGLEGNVASGGRLNARAALERLGAPSPPSSDPEPQPAQTTRSASELGSSPAAAVRGTVSRAGVSARSVIRRGLRIGCSGPTGGRCGVLVRLARRTLGRRTVSLGRDGAAGFRVRLSRRGRRLLVQRTRGRRTARVSLVLRVASPGGSVSRFSRRVEVR